jgi:Holliday junction resolvase-like predicted endonuclease
MAIAKAKVSPDLAREFEALGVPVVTHRLTRFKDARLREAAHLWLAQQHAERDAARRAAVAQRANRRYRRMLIIATAVGIIGWVIAVAVILR